MKTEQEFVITKKGVLTEYNGPGGDVVIPEGVKEIGKRAFQNCTGLTSAVIPESVTEIGYGAFMGCTGLQSVTVPGSVSAICSDAFKNCIGLQSVTLLEGLVEIGYCAFYGCSGLRNIAIPASVAQISKSAFSHCAGLQSVSLPEGITEIAQATFYQCTSLQNFTIPESVTALGWDAFRDCTGLESIVIPAHITEINSSIFSGCDRLALIAPHIPISGFETVDKFKACAGFAKAYLDGTEMDEEIRAGYLKYIKGQRKRLVLDAVQHEELLQLMIKEKMLARADIDPLLTECDRQNNVAAKAAVLDYAGRSLKPVDPFDEMEKELAKAERQARRFEETGQLPASELKKIWSTKKREDGTLEITSYKGTDATVSVPAVIGKTAVTAIGEKALSPLASRLTPEQKRVRETLESVTIPAGVTEISKSAFSGCTGLTDVAIAEGVTNITHYTFSDTPWFKNLGELAVVNHILLKYRGNSGDVTIPEGVTKIGNGAFQGCTGLTSVTIPEGVTEIGVFAFYDCTGLISVTIPADVKEIGMDAFTHCPNLTIHAPAGSYAEEYAKKKKIKFGAI